MYNNNNNKQLIPSAILTLLGLGSFAVSLSSRNKKTAVSFADLAIKFLDKAKEELNKVEKITENNKNEEIKTEIKTETNKENIIFELNGKKYLLIEEIIKYEYYDRLKIIVNNCECVIQKKKYKEKFFISKILVPEENINLFTGLISSLIG